MFYRDSKASAAVTAELEALKATMRQQAEREEKVSNLKATAAYFVSCFYTFPLQLRQEVEVLRSMSSPTESSGVESVRAELERVKRRHEEEIDTLLKVSYIL